MSKHILLSGCHHVKSSHCQQLRPKSKACAPALKIPPSVHLKRPGTGRLGCLLAADIAALKWNHTADAVFIRCQGMDAPIWHRNSLRPCSAAHARTATVTEECSVVGAWMAV